MLLRSSCVLVEFSSEDANQLIKSDKWQLPSRRDIGVSGRCLAETSPAETPVPWTCRGGCTRQHFTPLPGRAQQRARARWTLWQLGWCWQDPCAAAVPAGVHPGGCHQAGRGRRDGGGHRDGGYLTRRWEMPPHLCGWKKRG